MDASCQESTGKLSRYFYTSFQPLALYQTPRTAHRMAAKSNIVEFNSAPINNCVYSSSTETGLIKISDCGSPSCPNSEANPDKE
ncbi:uncharacterized protein UV8b_07267 [Ustilaginoidea virens]|uniref:Uncharacterized protein n=1 Tax=Ustilaginoidea virens TaxID=1159556 RepID=A0A8E5MKF2_USTVR|nr:uncharacterized protein UV8b_07267 [Ustilaginoidea virens]QUC23026.1 hypothetical protein UV8b_07267 [Ustilaginoidea virens]